MSVTSPAPAALRILRAEQRLEVDWADGHASTYEATALRWLCPCAYCRGEAGMPGWLDANPSLTPQQTTLEGGGMIGNYAVCLFWGDGHRTGYYTWPLLRSHCPCAACLEIPR
ncbi:MAG: DUF971 domain-containing protein [Chloroflexi bacterium]|nr:MAG: DUF971 domain-containing protein [Chloroflexota bacterium]